jgi:mannose-1-phosphate guanylyltransferase/mannose-1-phosphate guanylyltransferase/mannose-6-phosphate isomerase
MPKPFLPLVGERTLFEETLQRTAADPLFGPPIVVTGAAHLDLVDRQSADFELREVIVEPEPKQTAAAVALAATRVDRDAVILVCPSDHHIGDVDAFRTAAAAAAETARRGFLVCIAVTASEADTRFGYVRRGEPLGPGSFRVAEFVEKPNRETAAEYLESGLYSWNGGIFAFRAGDYLAELRKFRPSLAQAVEQSAARGEAVGRRFLPDRDSFATIDAESLDYAVMEETDRAAMVEAEMQWSDVGSWEALFRMRVKDGAGNTVRGSAQLVDCANVLVDSDGPRVHMIGVENMVVVVDGDDILVATATGARDVANLIATKRK